MFPQGRLPVGRGAPVRQHELGGGEQAFALLEYALDPRDYYAIHALTNWPVLDDLRPDPRFQSLVRRIGW